MNYIKLKYGFVASIGCGLPWLDSWVDRYNSEVEKINTWYSERGYCPENILNGAHNLFCTYSIDYSKVRKIS